MTNRDLTEIPPFLTIRGQTVAFVHAPCNACGCEIDDEVLRGNDRLGLPGRFRVARCRACGILRQNPRPTSDTIGAYYPAEYEPFAQSARRERNRLRRLDLWYGIFKRRRLVEKHCPGGSVLDVGCATGNFLAEMKRTGRWRTIGIEPSDAAANVAQTWHGLDVRIGRVGDVELPGGSLDVVTLWNVLEHLHEPVDDLSRVAGWLRPAGLLIASLPNLESVDRRLFGDRWVEWELPRHLYFFSQATLGSVLDRLGFQVVERTCVSGGQALFAQSLKAIALQPNERRPWIRLAARIIPTLPARLTLLPTFYVLGRLGLSSTVTIVARKWRDGLS